MPNWRRIGIGTGIGIAALAVGAGLYSWLGGRDKNGDDNVPPPDDVGVNDTEESAPDAGVQSVELRLQYDIRCVDDHGVELPVRKQWSDPRNFTYTPFFVHPGVEYTCMAANVDEKLVSVKLELTVRDAAGQNPAYHRVGGSSLDEETNRVKFSLVEEGEYRMTFGVGGENDTRAKKTRELTFVYDADVSAAPQVELNAASAPSGYLDILSVERSGGVGR